MFERDLQARLSRIFGLSKTTLLAPDHETPEQDTLFVTVIEAIPRLGGSVATQTARVRGMLTVFSQGMLNETKADTADEEEDKQVRLPFGFFAKRIANADPADVKPFFFQSEQEVTNSPVRVVNLHERQVPFNYLFSAQYDPDRGELNELEINVEDDLDE